MLYTAYNTHIYNRDNVALQELSNQLRDELTAARKTRDESVAQLQAAKAERANFEIQLRQSEKNFNTTKDSVCASFLLYFLSLLIHIHHIDSFYLYYK